jgi:hypothetical protein
LEKHSVFGVFFACRAISEASPSCPVRTTEALTMKANYEFTRLMLRLPPDLKEYLEQQAAKNMTSQNAEIVRAIRFRQEAEQQRA